MSTGSMILKPYVENVMLHAGKAHTQNVENFLENDLKYKKISGKANADGFPCVTFNIKPDEMF